MKSQLLTLRLFCLTQKVLLRTYSTLIRPKLTFHVGLRGRRHLVIVKSERSEEEMADRAAIQNQIKEQGEVVRKLKTEKADKEKVLLIKLGNPEGIYAIACTLDPIYTGLVTTVQVLYLLEICCRG